jgi:hypothetical protein
MADLELGQHSVGTGHTLRMIAQIMSADAPYGYSRLSCGCSYPDGQLRVGRCCSL